MNRRAMIMALANAAMWPLVVRAQQPVGRVYHVGYFAFGSREQQLHTLSGIGSCRAIPMLR
jgi:hypothetical protein